MCIMATRGSVWKRRVTQSMYSDKLAVGLCYVYYGYQRLCKEEAYNTVNVFKQIGSRLVLCVLWLPEVLYGRGV